jgi:hypothetical protein
MPKCIESRLALLEATQNRDGGWGYFPGKQSWLEPTAYTLLALSGDARGRPAFERGWRLLRSWQAPAGGWRAGAVVNEVHWATSLAVTLHAVVGVYDGAFRRGMEWLLASTGAESRLVSRVAHWLQPSVVEFAPELVGWPWETGASSWIEPTAHALMALRCAARRMEPADLANRIDTGERMLLERRCRDGGWNYGNRRVLGADLPSYPETTALALMALGGHASVKWGAALDRVQQLWSETRSPLARAWLAACLLVYRGERPREAEQAPVGNDILVAAVEAIPWDQIAAI